VRDLAGVDITLFLSLSLSHDRNKHFGFALELFLKISVFFELKHGKFSLQKSNMKSTTINIRPLTPALAKLAAEELNETPDRLQSDLKALKEWIKQSPHLRVRTDDQFLVTFLRGCKFSLEKAKQKFDLYYTVRSDLPEVMLNRDPLNERLKLIIRLG
jgi:hypothetical protein